MYRQSFSRLVSAEAAQIRSAKTAVEAQELITQAIETGIAVNFRGAGHSFGDRCISRGGLLLLNELRRPVERLDDSHFSVASGSSWLAVERALNAQGRSAPVLSNWLHVTVAGTLSAGGYGAASLRYGGQTDNVASVTLIDAAGELRTISRDSGPEWTVATCAAGRLGFLTDCVLSTVPASRSIRLSRRGFDTVDALAASFRHAVAATDGPDMAWAEVKAGSFLQFAAERSDSDTSRPLLDGNGARHDALTWDTWLQLHSEREFVDDVAYIWSDYVVPEAAFESFVRRAWSLAAEDSEAALSRPRMRILAMDGRDRPRSAQLLAASRLAEPGLCFGIGVYLEPPLKRPDRVDRARAVLASLLETCIEHGGRPYFGSWHELSEQRARVVYGADYDAARDILKRLPHAHLINPGTMPPL